MSRISECHCGPSGFFCLMSALTEPWDGRMAGLLLDVISMRRYAEAMDVHLSPDVERIVRCKLQTGRYGSASDVVSEALRLLEQRDDIRNKIDQGLRSVRKGRGL